MSRTTGYGTSTLIIYNPTSLIGSRATPATSSPLFSLIAGGITGLREQCLKYIVKDFSLPPLALLRALTHQGLWIKPKIRGEEEGWKGGQKVRDPYQLLNYNSFQPFQIRPFKNQRE